MDKPKKQKDNPITRSPWQTFQARGIIGVKKIVVLPVVSLIVGRNKEWQQMNGQSDL